MRKVVQQIWQGDSRELLKRFRPGTVIDCIITDPPFGTNNLSRSSVTERGKKYARKIEGDLSPEEAINLFQEVMQIALPMMAENSDVYVFTSYQVLREWLNMVDDFMDDFGFRRKAILWWEKDGPGQGDLSYPWGMCAEIILAYRIGSMDLKTARRNSTLHFPQVHPSKLIHPHEKPVGMLEAMIKGSTDPGDFLVDPFGGSGSLARAAYNTGRSCVSMEIDPMNWKLATEAFERHKGGIPLHA